MPFSWANQKEKTKVHLLQRTITLLRMNPDFQVNHPELAREISKGITKVETKKYVDKLILKKFRYGETPKDSVIVKRLNRRV